MIHAVIGRLTSRAIPRGRTGLAALVVALLTLAAAPGARAQPAPADGETRAGTIEAQQQEKAGKLAPYEPNNAELWVKKVEEMFLTGNVKWHPFFTSAYGGGGFTLGAGYLAHVRDYDTLDVRGSYTFSNYKRIESRVHRAAAVRAPRPALRPRRLARGAAGQLLRRRQRQ